MRKISKISCTAFLCVIIAATCVLDTSALEADDLAEGIYSVDSTLSCYVNAMGGVEFGTPLLVSSQINVDGNHNKTMTLNFRKSSVTIYNITCDTFIDPAPESNDSSTNVENGTLGFYDNSGALQTSSVEYTLSEDTALNPRNEGVHYVSSMTFPIDGTRDTYELTLYVNSNVMGVQFGAGGSSNPATLTVNWSTLKSGDAKQEQQLETLPDATQKAQTSTEVVVEEAKDNVVEKNGLNIHYANGESEAAKETTVQYTAHLNMPMIWLLIGASAAVILVGTVFLISTKFNRKQGNK